MPHEALRCGVPHAGVGQFSIGDPGQFCTGGYSAAGDWLPYSIEATGRGLSRRHCPLPRGRQSFIH
jgi:hypothetical protein